MSAQRQQKSIKFEKGGGWSKTNQRQAPKLQELPKEAVSEAWSEMAVKVESSVHTPASMLSAHLGTPTPAELKEADEEWRLNNRPV